MTAPRTTTRARRATGAADTIPPAVAAWFAGQPGPMPWAALLPHDAQQVPGWWRQWAAGHPGATPPAGVPWINWGTP